MATYEFSILVDASPDRVFDRFTDLGRLQEWVGGVSRA